MMPPPPPRKRPRTGGAKFLPSLLDSAPQFPNTASQPTPQAQTSKMQEDTFAGLMASPPTPPMLAGNRRTAMVSEISPFELPGSPTRSQSQRTSSSSADGFSSRGEVQISFDSQSQSSMMDTGTQQSQDFLTPVDHPISKNSAEQVAKELQIARSRQPSAPAQFLIQSLINPFAQCHIDEKSQFGSNGLKNKKSRRRSDGMSSNMEIGKLRRDFEIIQRGGEGSFGEVWKCRKYLDGSLYAVKVIRGASGGGVAGLSTMLNEVWALSALASREIGRAHLHILRYFDSWIEEDERERTLFIQTQFCSRGDMLSQLEQEEHNRKLLPHMIDQILLQMSCALEGVHKIGMVHADVKPANILESHKGHYVLSDFGLTFMKKPEFAYSSSNSSQDRSTSQKRMRPIERGEGDRRYLAPEVLNFQEDDLNEQFAEKRDIWALAASIVELAIGRRLPESGLTWMEVQQAESYLAESGAHSCRFIEEMLRSDPRERPSAAEIVTRMEDLIHGSKREFFEGESLFGLPGNRRGLN